MKRIKSGIGGFDKIVYGGIPRGSVVMVSGSAGAGKTIFSLQALSYGAKNGGRGLYITFEQEPNEVIEQAREFKWDIDNLVKKGMFRIVRIRHPHYMKEKEGFGKVLEEWKLPEELKEEITNEIEKFKPRRVVIDSLSTMGSALRSGVADSIKRDIIIDLIDALRGKGLDVAFVTEELPHSGEWFSNDGISEFLVDGIIVIRKISSGMGVARMLSVEKMRKTNHNIEKFPLSIEDGHGVIVKLPEETMK